MSIKFLHTSDWHIGRTLYGKRRFAEFENFFAWLVETVKENSIDVLLVAGDIFDNATPSNRAQEIYYDLLHQAAASKCRHIVIIGGNHDSPTFLDAPKSLLKSLNVHVVGSITPDTPEDEVLVLSDEQNLPEAIVCAVPYLRDRDIRTAIPGESIKDKGKNLIEGIRRHYQRVGQVAEEKRRTLNVDVPIVGMGHLFAAGGKVEDGDGVRELYVGSLAHVSGGIFPKCFDYVALGHLHIPQRVGQQETIRYCGSPLPMGFGEAGQQKVVCMVEFEGTAPSVTQIEIPVFQELKLLKGNWNDISQGIADLKAAGKNVWLDVVYDSAEVRASLRNDLEQEIDNSKIEILRVKNNRNIGVKPPDLGNEGKLPELEPNEIFKQCLEAHQVPDEQICDLRDAHKEILASIVEQDTMSV
ncbi:MAG: exonuclease SbcCD subunit D C-terminal domain-containing protein [Acidiferrobacterales bacterium]|nr:exonuclease SbcCD subunit D C-terminal domain-containing protein [Acidiferrobacterales bacterium]